MWTSGERCVDFWRKMCGLLEKDVWTSGERSVDFWRKMCGLLENLLLTDLHVRKLEFE